MVKVSVAIYNRSIPVTDYLGTYWQENDTKDIYIIGRMPSWDFNTRYGLINLSTGNYYDGSHQNIESLLNTCKRELTQIPVKSVVTITI